MTGAVKELIQEGKVRRFVLCEVRPETIRRAHAVQPVTAVQSKYHLMWRSPEQEVLPTLEELGIGFVPYNPANRGFLGETLNEYTHFKSGNDNRGKLPHFSPEAMRANMALEEALADFVQTRGMTSAQVGSSGVAAGQKAVDRPHSRTNQAVTSGRKPARGRLRAHRQ